MKTLTTSILLILCLTALSADYQEILSVQMVRVYLTARDHDGRFVTDLRPEELVLKEDGEAQEIVDFTNFSNEPAADANELLPLTMVFSMDISGSMSGLSASRQKKIEVAKKAALALVPELGPNDQMSVFGFHSLPKLIVPMTSDPALIEQKLKMQKAVPEETALFDSLFIILDQIQQFEGRKIIVLGSDGVDTSSHVTFESLLEQLRRSDVTMLAFGMQSSDLKTPDKRYVLEKLAQATGGYAFFPDSDRDLYNIISTIRRIISSQYVLWYAPRNEASGKDWRSIELECKRPGIELRYRKGYRMNEGRVQTASKSGS